MLSKAKYFNIDRADPKCHSPNGLSVICCSLNVTITNAADDIFSGIYMLIFSEIRLEISSLTCLLIKVTKFESVVCCKF